MLGLWEKNQKIMQKLYLSCMYQKLETAEAKSVPDFFIAFVLVLNNLFLLKRELCPFSSSQQYSHF